MMHHAVYRNNFGLVKKLLDGGYYYETPDEQGNTALHLAAQQGLDPKLVEILTHKIRIPTRNKENKTALHVACASGFLEGVKVLMEHEDGTAILELEDNRKQTALLIASSSGNTDIVDYLIKKGADYHRRNLSKESALHIAARHYSPT